MTTFEWALAAFTLFYALALALVLLRSARKSARATDPGTTLPDQSAGQSDPTKASRHASTDRLSEFFVSGRDVGLWSAIATLGATEIGLITIAYNAQKGFNEDFAAFHIGIAALIGCVFVGLTGFIVAPLRRTGGRVLLDLRPWPGESGPRPRRRLIGRDRLCDHRSLARRVHHRLAE